MDRIVRVSCVVAAIIVFSASCAENPQRACVGRLSKHFAAGKTLSSNASAKSSSEVRTLLGQMKSLVETADTQGCDSKTLLAVIELKASIGDLQAAISDPQLLVHNLFALFNAGESSPLSEQGRAAIRRMENAIKLLKDSGVDVQGLE